MDSMIGYKNERYYYFGTAGARLDDLMNYIPARLSIIIVTAAAFFSGMNTSGCLRTGLRDRLKHASPNSGHPESCFAGALGLTLGGPSKYHGIIIDKPWIGKGSKEAGEEDILKALVLNKVSFFFTLFMVVILFFIFRVRY
jgi:adenosylcobinamide-phosphate synthase